MIRLLPGDCRDILPTLEAGSVHCVVTSPPYYGLRDYGTAQWDGGDAGCDHSMAIKAGDPVPPACRRCQKCRKMCRTQWTSATSVRSECDQCGVATDYNDVDSRGTSWGVVRKTGHADTGDLVWALPHQRYPGDICRCGARRIDRQIGLEATPDEYIATMVEVFREIKRVLRDDGTVFCNMGDGYQDKQLLMMPARLALALQADGWWLRSQIVWAKPNPMPESVTDRPTSAYEMVYLLAKRSRYYYDAGAVREEAFSGSTSPFRGAAYVNQGSAPCNSTHRGTVMQGLMDTTSRNSRNVWTIATSPYSEAHFATFPPELAERCIRAGTSERGCCAQCGTPWVRMVEKQFRSLRGNSIKAGHTGKHLDASVGWSDEGCGVNEVTTTGWQPGCRCEARCLRMGCRSSGSPPLLVDGVCPKCGTRQQAEPVPCTVLDPFAGAGTTLLVADRLQRNAIGIELNASYTEMAMERVKRDAPLFADLAPVPSEDAYDRPLRDLFEEAAD